MFHQQNEIKYLQTTPDELQKDFLKSISSFKKAAKALQILVNDNDGSMGKSGEHLITEAKAVRVEVSKKQHALELWVPNGQQKFGPPRPTFEGTRFDTLFQR